MREKMISLLTEDAGFWISAATPTLTSTKVDVSLPFVEQSVELSLHRRSAESRDLWVEGVPIAGGTDGACDDWLVGTTLGVSIAWLLYKCMFVMCLLQAFTKEKVLEQNLQ